MADDETERLDTVADWYETEGFYQKILKQGYRSIRPHFTGKRCLELGCADGAMTEHLLDDFETVVAVDGASEYCELVRSRLSSDRLDVICSLFEDFRPERQADTIIMAHVLEHVKDPVKILQRAESWMRDDGRIIIIVPNGNSLHRQVAVEMGLLQRPDEIDDHDEELGHRRVYLPDELRDHITQSGLKLRNMGGVALKPLTNSQMNELLDEEIQDAYLQMGDQYPKIAAECYAICGRRAKN